MDNPNWIKSESDKKKSQKCNTSLILLHIKTLNGQAKRTVITQNIWNCH